MSQQPSSSHRKGAAPSSLGRVAPASASGVTSPSTISSSSSRPHSIVHIPPEDRLPKTWRTLANCFIAGCQKAEKVSKATISNNKQELAVSMKELDDYVVLFLRTRNEWARLIPYLEAKLEGTAQEMETIQNYYRTTPTLLSFSSSTAQSTAAVSADEDDSRKRKRDDVEDESQQGMPQAKVANSYG